jgi:hypothetical protein
MKTKNITALIFYDKPGIDHSILKFCRREKIEGKEVNLHYYMKLNKIVREWYKWENQEEAKNRTIVWHLFNWDKLPYWINILNKPYVIRALYDCGSEYSKKNNLRHDRLKIETDKHYLNIDDAICEDNSARPFRPSDSYGSFDYTDWPLDEWIIS